MITDEVSCTVGNVDSSGEPEIMILEEWIIGFIAYNRLYVTFFACKHQVQHVDHTYIHTTSIEETKTGVVELDD